MKVDVNMIGNEVSLICLPDLTFNTAKIFTLRTPSHVLREYETLMLAALVLALREQDGAIVVGVLVITNISTP